MTSIQNVAKLEEVKADSIETVRALDITEIARREEMVEVEASVCICSTWF